MKTMNNLIKNNSITFLEICKLIDKIMNELREQFPDDYK